jgi:hypothetical protein
MNFLSSPHGNLIVSKMHSLKLLSPSTMCMLLLSSPNQPLPPTLHPQQNSQIRKYRSQHVMNAFYTTVQGVKQWSIFEINLLLKLVSTYFTSVAAFPQNQLCKIFLKTNTLFFLVIICSLTLFTY